MNQNTETTSACGLFKIAWHIDKHNSKGSEKGLSILLSAAPTPQFGRYKASERLMGFLSPPQKNILKLGCDGRIQELNVFTGDERLCKFEFKFAPESIDR